MKEFLEWLVDLVRHFLRDSREKAWWQKGVTVAPVIGQLDDTVSVKDMSRVAWQSYHIFGLRERLKADGALVSFQRLCVV